MKSFSSLIFFFWIFNKLSSSIISPLFKIITLLHIASISWRIWDDIRTILFFARLLIKFRISKVWLGSSPVVGSSKNKISGLWKIDAAIPTLWRYPFESSFIFCFECIVYSRKRSSSKMFKNKFRGITYFSKIYTSFYSHPI